MRARVASLVALSLWFPSRASPDTLVGSRGELVERKNAIELTVHRGRAVLVVRRTFENPGAKHDQAVLDIDSMPSGAVATGLRTLGTMNGKPTWFAGELMDAELAAARYRYFTGIGGYYPKDPALLSWRASDHLRLQVFPLEPKKQKTIEYTLEAPTRYVNGVYTIDLPSMGTELFAATVSAHAADPGDVLFVDDVPGGASSLRLTDGVRFELAPHDPPALSGRFASIGIAKGRALLHAAIEVAPRLGEPPKGAYVVVLLDASRSISAADREAERAAAAAYLRHLPDAHVQVLAFDHKVRPLQDGFVSSKQALADLEAAPLTPRNGSHLDVALSEALARLAKVKADAPRRIVAMTDLRMRQSLTPAAVRALNFDRTLVHLATVTNGRPLLRRDDKDPWATVPRATGGLLWRATANRDLLSLYDHHRVFEEWVRPIRIDGLTLTGVGEQGAIPLPRSLSEGEAFDDLRLHNFPTPALEIRGEVWANKVTTLLATSPAEERLWSALVFGSPVHKDLTDKETALVAMRGRAVSPMTSYLAIEPGVRPSTEGLDHAFGEGWGTVGGFSHGSGWGHGLDYGIDGSALRAKVAKIVASCGAPATRVRIETTFAEILDVDVQSQPTAKESRACVEAGVWDLELPADLAGAERRTWHFEFEDGA